MLSPFHAMPQQFLIQKTLLAIFNSSAVSNHLANSSIEGRSILSFQNVGKETYFYQYTYYLVRNMSTIGFLTNKLNIPYFLKESFAW